LPSEAVATDANASFDLHAVFSAQKRRLPHRNRYSGSPCRFLEVFESCFGVCLSDTGVIRECEALLVCEACLVPSACFFLDPLACFFARPGGMQFLLPGVQPHPVLLP
jgi:hypothetical protein